MSSPPCELYPPGDPAGDFDPPADGTTKAAPETGDVDVPASTMPVCAEPAPPANVPDEATAESQARQLFTSLGIDAGSYEFETYADEWGANVTGYLVLDGIRTSVAVSVGYGAEGALTWASGFLATPQRGADYPRIGIEAAVQRLNDQSSSWMGLDTPMMTDTGSGRAAESAGAGTSGSPGDAAVGTETAVAPPAVDEPVVADPATEVAPAPDQPEPMVDPAEGVASTTRAPSAPRPPPSRPSRSRSADQRPAVARAVVGQRRHRLVAARLRLRRGRQWHLLGAGRRRPVHRGRRGRPRSPVPRAGRSSQTIEPADAR